MQACASALSCCLLLMTSVLIPFPARAQQPAATPFRACPSPRCSLQEPAARLLGPYQHSSVLRRRCLPRPGLCFHPQFSGARPRRNSDPGRHRQQLRRICQPGGGGDAHFRRPLLLDASRQPPQDRTLDLDRPHRGHRLRSGKKLFAGIEALGPVKCGSARRTKHKVGDAALRTVLYCSQALPRRSS